MYVLSYSGISNENAEGYHEAGGGGSFGDRSMMLHVDYGQRKEEEGIIEELFMHEGAHASLDGEHYNVIALIHN